MIENFYCTPWGKLNAYLYLNIFLKFIGQSPTTISGSTQSLPRCITIWFLINTWSSTSAGCLSPVWLPSPVPALLPRGGPWAWLSRISPRQCCGFSLSQQEGKLHSVPGSPPASGIPACSRLIPSAAGPFCLPCQAISLALLSTYHLNFPFRYFCTDLSLDIDKVSWRIWSERGKRSKASMLNPKITI